MVKNTNRISIITIQNELFYSKSYIKEGLVEIINNIQKEWHANC